MEKNGGGFPWIPPVRIPYKTPLTQKIKGLPKGQGLYSCVYVGVYWDVPGNTQEIRINAW